MNPLCSVLAQVHGGRVHILEEMILPDSNALTACEELLSRTQKWKTGIPLDVYVYGTRPESSAGPPPPARTGRS